MAPDTAKHPRRPVHDEIKFKKPHYAYKFGAYQDMRDRTQPEQNARKPLVAASPVSVSDITPAVVSVVAWPI
eukprot:131178-Rhodomonas_salina.2